MSDPVHQMNDFLVSGVGVGASVPECLRSVSGIHHANQRIMLINYWIPARSTRE